MSFISRKIEFNKYLAGKKYSSYEEFINSNGEDPVTMSARTTPVKKVEEITKPVVEDCKITMQNRSTCPIHVKTVDEEKANTSSIEEAVQMHEFAHLKELLLNNGVQFNGIRKMPTGLWEIDIVLVNGSLQTITIDYDNIVYGNLINKNMIPFWIGRINPMMEYNSNAIRLTKESVGQLVNNLPIDQKFYIPAQWNTLNKIIDLRSIPYIDDNKTKDKFISNIIESVADDKDTAMNYLGCEPRFKVIDFKDISNFKLTTSNEIVVSNLNPSIKLDTKRTFNIDVVNQHK